MSYRFQFIDWARFMAISLPNLVNNLAEGIHKIKCKNDKNDTMLKNVKLAELNTKMVSVILNTTNFENDLIE